MASRNIISSRKGFFAVVCLLLLGFIGCISIPLGDPEKAKVDDKLIGAWISKPSDDGKQTLFTVVPYDEHTCLVTEFEFAKDGEKIQPGGRLDWKMWEVDVKGTPFISCEVKSPQLAMEPNPDTFAASKLTRNGDTITLQAVKDEFVKNANVTTSKQLEDLVGANLGNADMFGDPIALTKVKDSQKEMVGKVIEAYSSTAPVQ